MSGLVLVLGLSGGLTAGATPAPQLTRYPYLTDDSGSHATVELASAVQSPNVTLTYGPSPGCTGASVSAAGAPITVNGKSEYQFTLHLTGLAAGTMYCYGVAQGTTNLLGSDPKPSFRSALAAGDATPFNFAVIGDWGYDGAGPNAQLTALMNSIHSNNVSFALSTGDIAYDDGSQTNYGDLQQTGNSISAVFGADYWAKNGASVPMFAGLGDHGFSAGSTHLQNWNAKDTAADSGGKDVLETYAGKDKTTSSNYPSIWYAFNWGVARFYVLTGTWGYNNVGSGTQYQVDYDYHWAPGAPELSWLQNDFSQHPSVPKFAFVYFPMHSDNPSQPTDTYYGGSSGLEALLAGNHVVATFNGHAHIYEHNRPQYGSMPTYITGGGGGVLEPVNSCSSFDQYALGWSPTKSVGYSCNAPKPTSQNQVNEYMLVQVSGGNVIVSAVNANGVKFDSTTYPITGGGTPPGVASHFSVVAPSTATAGSAFTATVTALDSSNSTVSTYAGAKNLSWSGLRSSPNGTPPVYPSNPVSFSGGAATVTLTGYASGSSSVAVSDGSISGSSSAISFSPGPAVALAPVSPGTVTAGTQFTETVNAVDPWGNVATGFAGSKSVAWSGPANAPNGAAPSYPSTVSFSAGVGKPAITLVDAQTTALTATTSGLASGTSPAFTVLGGAATALGAGSPGTQTAGVAFTLTVNAFDKYGNAAALSGAQNVTWSGAGNAPGGAAPNLPGKINFHNGVAPASITLYNAAPTALTVHLGSLGPGTSPTFTVLPGSTRGLVVTLPDSVSQGSMGNPGAVQSVDSWGNQSNDSSQLSLTSSDTGCNVGSPFCPKSVTLSGGQASFSFGMTDCGSQSITLTESGVASGSGTTRVSGAVCGSSAIPMQLSDLLVRYSQ